jgi:hypothetical protein
MELTIRNLNESDYHNILVDWWIQWSWEPPKRNFLPDNGTGGIIVYDGETPVCAGFLYVTNSDVSWVDWIISNKEYKMKDKRREAIILLISSLTNIAKNSGASYAYALIKNNSLIKTYEDLGYVKGDTYTSEIIKLL